MARLGISERVRIAVVRANGWRRLASARLLGGPALPWSMRGSNPGELLTVPQDLRTPDPSFRPEIEYGHFGLSGVSAYLDGRSPFDVAPPGVAWQRELHGFGWLRHLDGAADGKAAELARQYVLDWLARPAHRTGPAAEPIVRARRIISWISHTPLLLDEASAAEFDIIARGLLRDVNMLAGDWRTAGEGYPRLLVLTALLFAHTAIKGRDRQLTATARRLEFEIGRQILADGGHASRNPAVLIELLLDWLPLESCFRSSGREPPAWLVGATRRQLDMLKFLKLGDGTIARFNGMGRGDPAALATLLAYHDAAVPPWEVALASRYARLESAGTVVIVDVGPSPPLMLSGEAHAGCLALEASSEQAILFTNAGAPGLADQDWRAVARATASHSTACIGEQSSARLIRHTGLEAVMGQVPLQSNALVIATCAREGSDWVLRASHDGYVERLGLEHHRELRLSGDGTRIEGIDRMETRGQDRLRRDVPFAIHFHLHPQTVAERRSDCTVAIRLRDGQSWLFEAGGAAVSLEESTTFAGSSGPEHTHQIVLRGATGGVSHVRWSAVRRHAPIAPPTTTGTGTGTFEDKGHPQ